MIVKRITMLWSLSLVLNVCCSFVMHDVDGFYAGEPLFFIDVFDDNELPLKNVTYDSQDKRLNTTVNMTTTILPDESSNNEVVNFTESPKDSERLSSSKIPEASDYLESDEFELFGPPSTVIRKKDMGTIVSDINLTESSDYLSYQFTKIYLRAVTNLVQRIMDALFYVCESKATTRLSDTNNADYDVSPSRKLRKRDVVDTETKSSSMTNEYSQASSITVSTESSTDVSETDDNNIDSHTELHQEGTNSIIKDIVASTLSSQGEKSNTAIPSDITYQTKHSDSEKKSNITDQSNTLVDLKNNNIPKANQKNKHSDIENKTNIKLTVPHVTSKSTQDITLTANIKIAEPITNDERVEENLPDKKNHPVTGLQNDVVTVGELININNNYEFNDDILTREDDPDLERLNQEEFKPKFVQQPSEGGYEKSETSTGAATLLMIGTVLIVLVLGTAGAATAYVIRKRSLGGNHSGNQNSLSHRSAMA